MGEEKTTTATIGGAPVSWVALMGALLGGGTIIPLIYYIEGGGYHSLSYAVIVLVACILGPWGATTSGLIGGIIGFFLAPGTDLSTVFTYYVLPPLAAGLILNGKWKYVVWVPLIGLIFYELVPWYWPGDPRLGALPQPLLAFSPWYDFLSFPLLITVGRKKVGEWIRGNDKKKMFFGILLLQWISAEMWHLWGWAFYLEFFVPFPAYVVAVIEAFTVPFERLMLQIVAGIVGVPILQTLRKSGLRKIPGAVW